LRKDQIASQNFHDKRRHQLDLQLFELEDLRQAVAHLTEELQQTESDKQILLSEKSDVARTIALLQADLTRVKRDAEAFGRDLRLLRAEKENMDIKHQQEIMKTARSKKQMDTQIRLLTEQLANQRKTSLQTQALHDELRSS
jgi:hypothetical protein